jgi:predicted dehydrogenase
MNEHRPLRVLLIGHGHFGRQHATVWRKLAEENVACLVGIVVNSDASRNRLATETNVPVHRGLDGVSFDGIDAVDIVTPTATHFELVNRILPHAHILVEKPLAATSMEAETLAQLATNTSNLLAVGHVYRFHPMVRALRELTAEIPGLPQVIFGSMLNPADEAQPDAEPSMEMLHWFELSRMLNRAWRCCIGLTSSICCSALHPRCAPRYGTRTP